MTNEGMEPHPNSTHGVIPAKAGIQYGSAVRLVLEPLVAGYWIPACTGMTASVVKEMDSRVA
jgi:hypothetical protein